MISLGYLAGFVDGEGYLALARIPRSNRAPEFCVRLVVYNTDLEILLQIQRSWGGTISSVGQRKSGWKPSHALIWTNAAASEMVRHLLPHLRIKTTQARLLLDYQDDVARRPRDRDERGRLLPLPMSEQHRQEELFQRIKALNTRDPQVRKRQRLAQAVGAGTRRVAPSYVAGLVDGEGSLMITKSESQRDGLVQYRARITVANTDKRVLEDVQRFYGGILVSQGPRKAGWNPGYLLVWSDGMAEEFLASIRPHLRIKQAQARLLAEFLRHKSVTVQGHMGRGFAPFPAEVISYREQCHASMADLNRRGARPPAPSQRPHACPSGGQASRAISNTG